MSSHRSDAPEAGGIGIEAIVIVERTAISPDPGSEQKTIIPQ
jgi:hypothetical protein